MADPKTMIDKTLNFYDDVDASDGDNSTNRARLLVFLQQLYSFVWNYLEWEFTYDEVDINIPSDSESFDLGNLSYMELGHNGSVYDRARNFKMIEKSRAIVVEARNRAVAGSALDIDIFGIWFGALQLAYTTTSALSLHLFYRRSPTVLVDNTTALPSGINKYADTVLLPALIYQAMNTKNDAREIWGAQFREGLSQMARIEFPEKTSRRKMPLANRGW